MTGNSTGQSTEMASLNLQHSAPGGRAPRYPTAPASISKNGHGDDALSLPRPPGSQAQAVSTAPQPTGKRNRGRRQQRTSASTSERAQASVGETLPPATDGVASEVSGSHRQATNLRHERHQAAQRAPRQQYQHLQEDRPRGDYQHPPAHFGEDTSRPQRGGGGGRRMRKHNINHLCNFTCSREMYGDDLPSMFGSGYGSNVSRGPRRSRYSKEQFLQANCQFVVKEGNYSEFTSALDPDSLVNWDAIQQVRVLCHEQPACPICRSPPQIAKITRCGHIYCWHCMLQYLSYPDQDGHTSNKCPICQDYARKSDLKSVSVVTTTLAKVGDEVTFCLVRRHEMSTLVQPHTATGQASSLSDDSNCFTKLLAVNDDCILSGVIAKELSELSALLDELSGDADCGLQLPYVKQALELCKERRELLESAKPSSRRRRSKAGKPPSASEPAPEHDSNINAPPRHSSTTAAAAAATTGAAAAAVADGDDAATTRAADDVIVAAVDTYPFTSPAPDNPAAGAPPSSSISIPVEPATATDDQGTHGGAAPVAPTADAHVLAGDDVVVLASEAADGVAGAVVAASSPGYQYLYQAEDGQHCYLNPFSVAMLKEEYGNSLEAGPLRISARIVALEQMSMTEAYRKQYRSLRHLPLACEFVLCELDLKHQVSETTYVKFAEGVKEREGKRRRQQRAENKEKKRAETRAAKSSGYQNPLYPQHGSSASQAIPAATQASYAEDTGVLVGSVDSAGSAAASSPPSSSLQDEMFRIGSPGSAQSLSYSRATNCAVTTSAGGSGSPSALWPVLRSTDGNHAYPASSAAASYSQQGMSRSTPARSAAGGGGKTGSGDEESYVPSFQDSFTDALCTQMDERLAAAMESRQSRAAVAADISTGTAAAGSVASGGRGKKGKGKGRQKVLLLSNTSHRSG